MKGVWQDGEMFLRSRVTDKWKMLGGWRGLRKKKMQSRMKQQCNCAFHDQLHEGWPGTTKRLHCRLLPIKMN